MSVTKIISPVVLLLIVLSFQFINTYGFDRQRQPLPPHFLIPSRMVFILMLCCFVRSKSRLTVK